MPDKPEAVWQELIPEWSEAGWFERLAYGETRESLVAAILVAATGLKKNYSARIVEPKGSQALPEEYLEQIEQAFCQSERFKKTLCGQEVTFPWGHPDGIRIADTIADEP